jgi:putative ABC transport system ATP-binding protein
VAGSAAGTVVGIALEGQNLVKEYRTSAAVSRALDGVSLTVAKGRFLSIMGPSGSGKSTLLHLLGGLDLPTEGQVVLGGRVLSALSDDELTLCRRHHVGFVFQFFNLVPVLTASENVALPAVIDGRRDHTNRVDELLDLVGLTPDRDKLPSQLSGGQQQRVAIARALLNEPEVLLADEPTGNLDTRTGADVLAILDRVRRELGQTVVMVTHDPRAAATGDEVVALRDGRTVGDLRLDSGRALTPDQRVRKVQRWLAACETSEA